MLVLGYLISMGKHDYNPLDHLDGKGMWDAYIVSHGVSTDKWLVCAESVVFNWVLAGYFDISQLTEALGAISDLCKAAGWSRGCIYCSSRATVHDCSKCSNKGDSK